MNSKNGKVDTKTPPTPIIKRFKSIYYFSKSTNDRHTPDLLKYIPDLLKLLSCIIKQNNPQKHQEVSKLLFKDINEPINTQEGFESDKQKPLLFFKFPLSTLLDNAIENSEKRKIIEKLLWEETVEPSNEYNQEKKILLQTINNHLRDYNYNQTVCTTYDDESYKYKAIVQALSQIVIEKNEMVELLLNSNGSIFHRMIDVICKEVIDNPNRYTQIHNILNHSTFTCEEEQTNLILRLLCEELSESKDYPEINRILSEYIMNASPDSIQAVYLILQKIIDNPNRYQTQTKLLLSNIKKDSLNNQNIAKYQDIAKSFLNKIIDQNNVSNTISQENSLLSNVVKEYVTLEIQECLKIFTDLMVNSKALPYSMTRKFTKLILEIIKSYNDQSHKDDTITLTAAQWNSILKRLCNTNQYSKKQKKLIHKFISEFEVPTENNDDGFKSFIKYSMGMDEIRYKITDKDSYEYNSLQNPFKFILKNSSHQKKDLLKLFGHKSIDLKMVLCSVQNSLRWLIKDLKMWKDQTYKYYFESIVEEEYIILAMYKYIQNVIVNLLNIYKQANSSYKNLTWSELETLIEIQEYCNKEITKLENIHYNYRQKSFINFKGKYINIAEAVLNEDFELLMHIPKIITKISQLDCYKSNRSNLWYNLKDNIIYLLKSADTDLDLKKLIIDYEIQQDHPKFDCIEMLQAVDQYDLQNSSKKVVVSFAKKLGDSILPQLLLEGKIRGIDTLNSSHTNVYKLITKNRYILLKDKLECVRYFLENNLEFHKNFKTNISCCFIEAVRASYEDQSHKEEYIKKMVQLFLEHNIDLSFIEQESIFSKYESLVEKINSSIQYFKEKDAQNTDIDLLPVFHDIDESEETHHDTNVVGEE